MSAADPATSLRLRVPPEAEGQRLDQFLTTEIGDRTRAAVLRWIRGGRVSVDGARAGKAGLRLKPGMQLVVEIPEPPSTDLLAESIPLDVLYEDDALLVINKPAGLTVHPGHGQRGGTLVNALLGRGVPLSPRGAPDRPGIVHRLDRDTSGLLIVAKHEPAHAALSEAFAARDVEKVYRALVWGHPSPDAGSIDRGIGRSRRDPTRMAVQATRGRPRRAVTHYRTLEALPGFAYLELRLETGRTHQIRVHLESIHHPIVGDQRYGGRAWRGLQDPRKRKVVRELDRLALHASRLGLRHPTTGAELRFEAPVPDELTRLLGVLRVPS